MKVQRGEGCGPSSQAACGRAEERTHFLSTWFISCSPALVPICPRQSTRSSLPLSSFLNSEKMQSHIDNRDTTVFCDDDKSWLPAWTEWSPEDRKSTPLGVWVDCCISEMIGSQGLRPKRCFNPFHEFRIQQTPEKLWDCVRWGLLRESGWLWEGGT